MVHIFQDEEENEEQTLTMKEIEENKKKEKELQQKKVQNNNLASTLNYWNHCRMTLLWLCVCFACWHSPQLLSYSR